VKILTAIVNVMIMIVVIFSTQRQMHTVAIVVVSVCLSHWWFMPKWFNITNCVVHHTIE